MSLYTSVSDSAVIYVSICSGTNLRNVQPERGITFLSLSDIMLVKSDYQKPPNKFGNLTNPVAGQLPKLIIVQIVYV